MCWHGFCCEAKALTNEIKGVCYCMSWIRLLTPLLLLWLLPILRGIVGKIPVHKKVFLCKRTTSYPPYFIKHLSSVYVSMNPKFQRKMTTAACFWKPRKVISLLRFAEMFEMSTTEPEQNSWGNLCLGKFSPFAWLTEVILHQYPF